MRPLPAEVVTLIFRYLHEMRLAPVRAELRERVQRRACVYGHTFVLRRWATHVSFYLEGYTT